MRTSKYKIPSILGIIILLAGIAAGVFLLGQEQIFRLGASPDSQPRDVRVSNVTDTSFTISWTTEKPVIGYVSWGETPSLGQLARQVDASEKRVHELTIRELAPSTNYFLVISSGGEEYDNNGVPWTVQTAPTLSAPTSTTLASGKVVNADGSPAANVLVYLNGGQITQLSALTTENGTWTIPLSTARTKTLSSYATLAPDSLLEVFVQGEDDVSTAQTTVSNINPLPQITLGQTYDFRNSAENEEVSLPEADVALPEQSEELDPNWLGGLEITPDNPSASENVEVTLESINENGEVVFTDTPEFFGEGPPNAQITITVESDPITDNVEVAPDGSWSWSPPDNLEEGEHTVTLKWYDATGILRTLTRTFVVHAAEGEPSFESTPSGGTQTSTPSPSPSPSPIATTAPTSSPAPTMSPSPTPLATRASIPSTESGIPVAGSLTPTFLLATIGLLLFISGILISKRNTI